MLTSENCKRLTSKLKFDATCNFSSHEEAWRSPIRQVNLGNVHLRRALTLVQSRSGGREVEQAGYEYRVKFSSATGLTKACTHK